MHGTGFEPEEDSLRSPSRVANPLREMFVLASLGQTMHGTGFEPVNPYGTAS